MEEVIVGKQKIMLDVRDMMMLKTASRDSEASCNYGTSLRKEVISVLRG